MLGPLYHLTEHEDRVSALREAGRVSKSGTAVCCAVISRYASTIDRFYRNYVDDPDFLRIMQQDLAERQHMDTTDKDYFTTSLFHRPEELESGMVESGVAVDALLAVEGFAWQIPRLREKMEDRAYRTLLLDMIGATEGDSAVMAASGPRTSNTRQKWPARPSPEESIARPIRVGLPITPSSRSKPSSR